MKNNMQPMMKKNRKPANGSGNCLCLVRIIFFCLVVLNGSFIAYVTEIGSERLTSMYVFHIFNVILGVSGLITVIFSKAPSFRFLYAPPIAILTVYSFYITLRLVENSRVEVYTRDLAFWHAVVAIGTLLSTFAYSHYANEYYHWDWENEDDVEKEDEMSGDEVDEKDARKSIILIV